MTLSVPWAYLTGYVTDISIDGVVKLLTVEIQSG
jgi:hypothetical protein